MNIAVFTKYSDPKNDVHLNNGEAKEVEFRIDRGEIQTEQNRALGNGATLGKVLITDDKTGKRSWFRLEAKIINGRPSVEVTAVGVAKNTSQKRCTGTWRD